MNKRKIRATVAALVVGSLAFASCSSDEPDAGESDSGQTTTTAAAETTTTAGGETTTTGGAALPEAEPVSEELTSIDLVAADYSYTGLDAGAEVPAGLVEVNLANEGAEEHQATIVRLHDDTTLEDFAAAGASDPTGAAALALVDGFGGPIGAAPQGGEASAISNLVPGEYLMICFIPSPSDGVPHAAKGMLTPFTVTDTEPAATELRDEELDAIVDTSEFAFTLRDRAGNEVPTLPGQGLFRLRNDGNQSHEAAVYRVLDGASLDDVLASFDPATASGPPPIEPAGGIAAERGANSVSAYFRLDLDAGDYVLLCFLPDVGDSGDGAPHFTKGMVLPFTVE